MSPLWIAAVVGATTTLATFGAGALRNGLRTGKEFNPMLASLPDRTAELKRITGVASNGGSCPESLGPWGATLADRACSPKACPLDESCARARNVNASL